MVFWSRGEGKLRKRERSKEAQKTWLVITQVITFCYLDFGFAELLKRNHRRNRHKGRIYTRDEFPPRRIIGQTTYY